MAEWKDGGWPVKELREAGYTALEMRLQGYGAKELNKHGYSIEDLVVGGYDIKTLRDIGATAGELRSAGINAKALSDVGYSAKELLVAGFSAEELIACGYGVAALREAGFTAIQLRALGFTAKELKDYGYGAAALKEAGCLVKELKELEFSDEELEEAGFSRRAVEAVNGRSVRELKEVGLYEVAELREYGYLVADLRGIYTVKDIKDQGFSLDELREGGMPEHAVLAVDGRSTKELRKAEYKAAILRKIGFLLFELAEGGYTASELKVARYGAEELKEVGFTAGSLRVAGFTSKQLRAARYGLKDMYEGGFEWFDLVIFLRATHADLTKAGFAGLDPLHRLFLEYREKEDDEIVADVKTSILSPRNTPGAMTLAAQPRMIETDAPLQVRSGVALTTKKLQVLPQGSKLKILESRVWREDGTLRALVAPADEGGGVAQILPHGWVTIKDHLGSPRARACDPGALSSYRSQLSSRPPDSNRVRLSARLTESAASSRGKEVKKQRFQLDKIDERMDGKVDAQQQRQQEKCDDPFAA